MRWCMILIIWKQSTYNLLQSRCEKHTFHARYRYYSQGSNHLEEGDHLIENYNHQGQQPTCESEHLLFGLHKHRSVLFECIVSVHKARLVARKSSNAWKDYEMLMYSSPNRLLQLENEVVRRCSSRTFSQRDWRLLVQCRMLLLFVAFDWTHSVLYLNCKRRKEGRKEGTYRAMELTAMWLQLFVE